ncbi:hypothetical protein OHA18_25120 [Kribbella sp. NBC_00709]|uniref:SPFH domain-containing protein n=1 Tax=Kribbella sp. NBC_00709 TaxID=2975972 RepID=UPI002E27D144|nr:SPFH domain-containing protein [Kribbella sp. NBC_00709]
MHLATPVLTLLFELEHDLFTSLMFTPALASPAAHSWAILGGLATLAAGAAVEPRRVPRDQWLVVLRSGRVARVATTGTTIRLPLLERYVWLPRAPICHPFVVTARTSEGIDVRLSGEIAIQIVDPAAAAEVSLSPTDLALDQAERALARVVGRCDVVTLAELPTYLDVEVAVPGVHITALDIGKVEIELTRHAVRSVADQTK